MIKIRITGPPADVSRAARAIAAALDVRRESDLYPNRNGGGCRLYIDADLPAEAAPCPDCDGELKPGPWGRACPGCGRYDPDEHAERLLASVDELEALAGRNEAGGRRDAARAARAKAAELRATVDAWMAETLRAVGWFGWQMTTKDLLKAAGSHVCDRWVK